MTTKQDKKAGAAAKRAEEREEAHEDALAEQRAEDKAAAKAASVEVVPVDRVGSDVAPPKEDAVPVVETAKPTLPVIRLGKPQAGKRFFVTNLGGICDVDMGGETIQAPPGRFEVVSYRPEYSSFDLAQHILARIQRQAPGSSFEEV